MVFYVHFLYLHKENEPKESAANHLIDQRSISLVARQERATSESRCASPSRLSVLGCATSAVW
jgi:hypothetical protein